MELMLLCISPHSEYYFDYTNIANPFFPSLQMFFQLWMLWCCLLLLSSPCHHSFTAAAVERFTFSLYSLLGILKGLKVYLSLRTTALLPATSRQISWVDIFIFVHIRLSYACVYLWSGYMLASNKGIAVAKKKYTRKKQCILTTLNSYPYDDDEVWIFRHFKLFCMSAFVSMTCHWIEKCTRSGSLLYHSLCVSVCMASSISNVMSEHRDMFVMSHTSAGRFSQQITSSSFSTRPVIIDDIFYTYSLQLVSTHSSSLSFFSKCAVE